MPKPRRALREVMRVLPGDEPPSEFIVFHPGLNLATDGVPALMDGEAARLVMADYRRLARGINLTFGHTRDSAGETALEERDGAVEVTVGLDADNEPIKETRVGPHIVAVNPKWTERAAEGVTAKEWRYTSAVFTYDLTGRITGLRQIGLTNDPATYGARPLMQLEREYQIEREQDPSLRAALQQIGAGLWPDAGDVYVDDILTSGEVIFEAYWRDDTGSVVRQAYFRAPYQVANEIPSLTAQPVEVERHVEYRPLAATPVAVEAQATDRSTPMNFLEALTAALMAAYADAVVKAPTAAYITTADGQNLMVPFDVAEDGAVTLGEAIPVSVGDAEQVAAAQRELNERLETLSREHTASLETARAEGLQTLDAERQKIAAREQAVGALESDMKKAALELGLHNGTVRVAERSLAEKWDLPTLLQVAQKGAKQFTAERERATPANIGGDKPKPKGKATGGRFVDGVLRFD